MNDDDAKSVLRARIAHARARQGSGRRNLLRGLTVAGLLAVAVAAGIWIGLQLDRETPPVSAPVEVPAPAASRMETPEASQPAEVPASAALRVDTQAASPPVEVPTPAASRMDTPAASTAAEAPAPATAPMQTPPADREPESAPPVEGRSASPDEEGAPKSAGTEPAPVSPVPAPADDRAPPPAPRTVSAEESAASAAAERAQFEKRLERLDNTLQAVLTRASLPPTDEAALERIRLHRDKALEAHRDGDTESAFRLLAGAEREAGELIRNEEARFRLSLQAAMDAYAAADSAAARMHIGQALEQRPDDPDARHWQARIARLPELLAQRRNAEDARGAGNLQQERAALHRIIELDPDDAGVRDRARTVDRQLREQAFARTIAQGRRAVEDQALERARNALATARSQDPHHAHTRHLHTQVEVLERTLARDRHLAAAEAAAAADDWEAALRAFGEARATEPTHAGAVSGSGLAARLVNAQRSVDTFLSRPDRLGSPEVVNAARDALREAAALTALSPRLASASQGLERAIEAGQTPVPVRVLSDDRTEIGIRGVGKIGRTRERTIELLPGRYVFEGRRKGYRSKLVEIVVQPNAGAPVEVRIVCDERS